MLRVILLLLLALGLVASVPALHRRAAGPASAIWHRIQPTVKRATDPIRASVTEREENVLVGQLQRIHGAGAALPTPEGFQHWLTLSSSVGTDGWGNQYYLVVNDDGVWVGSPGPDGIEGTPDDILTKCKW